MGQFLSDSSRADGRTGRPAVRQASRDTTETGNRQTDGHRLKDNGRERQREDTQRDRLRVFHIRHACVVPCSTPPPHCLHISKTVFVCLDPV